MNHEKLVSNDNYGNADCVSAIATGGDSAAVVKIMIYNADNTVSKTETNRTP